MDFDDTPDEAAYRARVRDLLAEHSADLVHLDAGLVGVAWAAEHGGQAGSLAQQAIVGQELARAEVPTLINHIGIGMCGPTVAAHGTPEQHDRYLTRLLRADDVWCQLFSEPASGSDLAALRTTAVRDGDDWVVNGQKVWTTLAHVADFGILLTRTDPDRPKHGGLTMFVVDMHAPGVTVRPLRQMGGQSDFNEVFFDDVRIPDSERLGEPGEGWRVALTTLLNERDRYTGYRRLTAISQGGLPGHEASAGKLAGTAAARLVSDAGVRLLGDDAVFAVGTGDDEAGRWQRNQAWLPGIAIAGGTDEVLRNIIGERVLGLPPEPREDKHRPFNAGSRA